MPRCHTTHKANHWRLIQTTNGEQIEKLFRTQKDIAEYMGVSKQIIKFYTAKCRDCNYKHKTTKSRWENIQIERLFGKEEPNPVEAV